MTITLQNDIILLEVDPAFGARVTSLRDLRTGREWLVQGPAVGDVSDAASYRGAEARGWDECFPTVAPCTHPVRGRLRDHGDLWGRPWSARGEGWLGYDGDGYSFDRRLTLSGDRVLADYAVTNTAEVPLDWMWSQHCLLDARPGDRLALEGIGPLQRTDVPTRVARDGTVLKTYGPVEGPAAATLAGPEGSIRFEWHGDQIGHFGLWLDFGGWPEEDPVHQLALEPTTAPADHLIAAGDDTETLTPGATRRWRVAIRLAAGARNAP
ncbi:hypothetical protein OG2516_15979 [Oceanicola granulosus HTCC2516]|uniref:Uncharacterized protein n=1 Tax=Oceanicola granulosus (strain ATCC BAA-861 / DSM 15982 / KCTC 12143 / HTCC2516) TaxID=314256 RepID=Q2CAL7_OCEGH|nr:hypothetical protein [Oceanicola granulosus]EAR49735.1 hypothetical protein OG2516_15979 [Oceanicola granulosus HTCC2516]